MRSTLVTFAVFLGATLIGISHAARLAPGPELPLDRVAASLLLCTLAAGSVVLLREAVRWLRRRAPGAPTPDAPAPSGVPAATHLPPSGRRRRLEAVETARSDWQGRPRRRPLRLVRPPHPASPGAADR